MDTNRRSHFRVKNAAKRLGAGLHRTCRLIEAEAIRAFRFRGTNATIVPAKRLDTLVDLWARDGFARHKQTYRKTRCSSRRKAEIATVTPGGEA